MPSPLDIHVPLVGQPLTPIHIEASALVLCNCKDTNRTVLYLVQGRPVACGDCGIIVTLLSGDSRTGQMQLDVKRKPIREPQEPQP